MPREGGSCFFPPSPLFLLSPTVLNIELKSQDRDDPVTERCSGLDDANGSFVPRETHFRSPFEASRPHLRAQSHSFIFYQARASVSSHSPFSIPFQTLSLPLSLSFPFLKGLDGENTLAIISSDRFRYQILLSTAWPREKYPEITPSTSRGTAFRCFVQETRARIRGDSNLSSRSSVTRADDTPRGHTFVSPWMALPFVLAKTSFLGFHFEPNALTFSLWKKRVAFRLFRSSSVKLLLISSLRFFESLVIVIVVDRSFFYLRSIFFFCFVKSSTANELFPSIVFIKNSIKLA